ncbi:MAG: hypothetical protein HQ445_09040 [Polaromonas sp.]|nr:hypothetical protein [Polaromonas sp.]
MALITKPLEQVRGDVPVQQEDMVRVNILVPASVRRRWKAFGVQVDETVTDMIIKAMTEYIKGKQP